MIIRSQDGQSLVNLDNTDAIEIKYTGESEYNIMAWNVDTKCRLAIYKTKKRANNVLDMICDNYQYLQECKYFGKVIGINAPEFVFQMPQDSNEVETHKYQLLDSIIEAMQNEVEE